MNVFNGAYVQTAGGLDGDQESGIIGDFPADDNFLLITARQTACRQRTTVIGTHIVCLDEFLRKGSHLPSVDPASG